MGRSTKTELSLSQAEECLPPWLAAMRKAAQGAISEEDVAAIVKGQVDKAKAGDQAAIKFLFDQILGGGQFKGATFVQNVTYTDGLGPPEQPTEARPGSRKKVALLAKRYQNGAELFNGNDNDGDPDGN